MLKCEKKISLFFVLHNIKIVHDFKTLQEFPEYFVTMEILSLGSGRILSNI